MMKALFRKLKNKAGESLIETLCAILIFTMASVVMFTMVNTAANINKQVKEMDAKNQAHMIAVEKGEASAKNGTAVITFNMDGSPVVSTRVDVYGGKDGSLYTYFVQPAPAEGG